MTAVNIDRATDIAPEQAVSADEPVGHKHNPGRVCICGAAYNIQALVLTQCAPLAPTRLTPMMRDAYVLLYATNAIEG